MSSLKSSVSYRGIWKYDDMDMFDFKMGVNTVHIVDCAHKVKKSALFGI